MELAFLLLESKWGVNFIRKQSLEGCTISNPVHTSETRMCGDNVHLPNYCLKGST